MALDNSSPVKLVVLVYGVKLIQVEVAEHTRLPDFLDTILQSDQYDLPQEAYTITRKYQSRHIRYLIPDRPILIQNLDDIPKRLDREQLLWIDVKVATTKWCARKNLPADGSCINLIIEEPLSIKDPELKGARRFYSREIVLFLEEYGIEVSPDPSATDERCKAWPGTMNKIDVWCKLVPEREAKAYEKLKPFNPEEHHVATVVVPPLALPTGDHLIVTPFYGDDLQEMIQWGCVALAGPFVHRLARQLCIAIDFLHDHNMYHLNIKPANLVIHEETDDLTVIDLGWVMSGKQPCYVSGVTGTYGYAPPEVREWFEWDKSARRKRYNPRMADAWAIGNVIHILLERVSKYGDPYEVTHSDELWDFGCWMMDDRPRMKEALEWLEQIDQKSGARIRVPSHVDRGTSP